MDSKFTQVVVPVGADSPFAASIGAHAAAMPQALRDQYLTPADAPYEIVVGGRMARIWHRPRWIRPFLSLLAREDILYPETGHDIPTSLVITPGRDERGAPIQLWDRTFNFRGRRRHFRSVMAVDAPSGQVIEIPGPRHFLAEYANVEFVAPDTIDFITVRSRLTLGRVRIPLPHRLWVTAHLRQRLDEATGMAHIELMVKHGILGPVFGYEGAFRTRRRPRRTFIA